jgi:hypothetical protein
MEAENGRAIQRVIAGGTGIPASADSRRDCPELSAAEFHRFLKAANDRDPDATLRNRRRARIACTLLAILLGGITLSTALLAVSPREEGTTQAGDFSRLQRAVCRSSLAFTPRVQPPLESLCPPLR